MIDKELLSRSIKESSFYMTNESRIIVVISMSKVGCVKKLQAVMVYPRRRFVHLGTY